MKKPLLFALLICSIFTLSAQKQPSYPFKNSIKLSPLSFANSTFMMNYERGFGKNSALVLSAGIYYHDNNYNYDSDNITTGYLGELQYRYYYLSKQGSHKGWNRLFFAPFAYERQYQATDDYVGPYFTNINEYNYTVNKYGGGVYMGYNLTFYKFSFEVYAGGGLKMCDDASRSDIGTIFSGFFNSSDNNGIGPKAGLNIGFSF